VILKVSISSTLNVRIFHTNVVSAAFFTYIRMYMRRTKAAKMKFVRNIRAYNVDEIDQRMIRQSVTRTSFKSLIWKLKFSSLKTQLCLKSPIIFMIQSITVTIHFYTLFKIYTSAYFYNKENCTKLKKSL